MRRLDLPCDDLNYCPDMTGPAHRASISGSQRPGSDDGPSATLGLLPMGLLFRVQLSDPDEISGLLDAEASLQAED